MSQPPPTEPRGPQATTTAAPQALAPAGASLILGILSLLLIGAYSVGIVRGLPYAGSFACGVIGVVLGHLARALVRRAAKGSGEAALARAGLVLNYVGGFVSLALFPFVTPLNRTVSP